MIQLIDLIEEVNNLFYNNSSSYKVLQSKQNELLTLLNPAMDIKKINYKTINKIIAYLQNKGNTNKTINAKMAYVSKLLTYALQNGLITSKPYIPYLKEDVKKEKYLTRPEVIQMLLWCRRHKQKDLQWIILIGLYTGLRINNILSLTADAYKNGILYIRDEKTNTDFILPVSSKIRYILKNFTGLQLKYAQVYYLFSLLKKDTGIDPNITIHTLRHTFCSNLIQKGIPITTIQKLANHKKLQTTMRYVHLNTQTLIDAINVL